MWKLSLAALTLCGCTSGATDVVAPTGTSITPAPIAHAAGSLDVVIQVGNYELGGNVDGFVYGPKLVINGDGSAFADLVDDVSDSAGTRRFISARVPESQLQTILRDAAALPDERIVGEEIPDQLALVLKVNGQIWEINDERLSPYKELLGEIDSTVRAAETGPWVPTEWIDRDLGDQQCVLRKVSLVKDNYRAAVFPHLVGKFPLGPFDCYGADVNSAQSQVCSDKLAAEVSRDQGVARRGRQEDCYGGETRT